MPKQLTFGQWKGFFKNMIPMIKIMGWWLIALVGAQAQHINTSVQAVVQVLPPYTLTLSDYTNADTDKLNVGLYFADPTLSSVEVKLRIRIESDKITLQTKSEYIPPKLILEDKDWLNLTGFDLADYFKTENLNISGTLQQGKLPEGLYRFCVEVLEYKRGVALSNVVCSAPVWLLLNEPPIWQMPRKNEVVEATFPQNLLLNWLPRHTGSPNALFDVEYELRVEPIFNENVNPQAIFTIQSTFAPIETDNTSYIMDGSAALQFEPGMKYAARVQAKDKSGRDLFRNNGYSEVLVFTFGQKCLPPTDPLINVQSYKSAAVSWTGNANSSEYVLNYHEKGQEVWYTKANLLLPNAQLSDLKANTQYEVKVRANCGSIEGEETSIVAFTTPDVPKDKFVCNDPNANTPPALSPTKKQSLNVGDIIIMRGANLKLVQVQGSNGIFSGKGIVIVPMLKNVGLEATFSNIGVNEDNKLTSGRVDVISGQVQVIDETSRQEISNLKMIVANSGVDNQQLVDDVTDLLATAPKLPVFAKALIEQGTDQIKQGQAMVAAGNTEAGQKLIQQGKTTLQQGLNKAGNAFGKPSGVGVVSLDKPAKTLATDANLTIKFDKNNQTQYGFDPYTNPLLKTKYERVIDQTTKAEIYPDWKALESGKPDYVNIQITASGSYKADSVQFETENGVSLPRGEGQGGVLLKLIGGTDGSDTRIYATYKTGTDERVLAQLNTASYDKVENKLILIPIGSAALDGTSIATAVNAIYKQALAEFTVEVKPSFTLPTGWDENSDGKIQVNASGLLSNYTGDMNAIIKAYKDANDNIDKDAYYLFVGIPASDAGQLGYMPRAKNFGFIFTNDDKTIAHELGHGVFHLKHTFDETSVPQSSSQNLMDYSTGTFLNKYQWDYVHDPAFVVGLFESDKAGAMKGSAFLDDEFIRKFFRNFKKAYSLNQKSVTASVSTNNLLTDIMTIKEGISIINSYDITLADKAYKSITIKIITKKALQPAVAKNTPFIPPLSETNYIVIDNALVITVSPQDDINELYKYLTEKVEDKGNLLLFVNGYFNFADLTKDYEPSNNVSVGTFKGFAIDNYWKGIDQQFIDKIGTFNSVYVSGHNYITTSNHNNGGDIPKSKISFGESLYGSSCAAGNPTLLTTYLAAGIITKNKTVVAAGIKCASCGNNPNCVELNSDKNGKTNVEGFNTRKLQGRAVGSSLAASIKNGTIPIAKNSSGTIIGKVDIVAHSMGFASAEGIAEVLKENNIPLGRLYAIAPENACSSSLVVSNFEEVWQYGSNENQDPLWEQDGIAPQCPITGLSNNNRVYIPDSEKAIKNFLDAHYISSYGWIFRREKNQSGYVNKR